MSVPFRGSERGESKNVKDPFSSSILPSLNIDVERPNAECRMPTAC